MRLDRAVMAAAILAALHAAPAAAQDDGAPLSAIDWLSRSVEVPRATAMMPPAPRPRPDEPPVADSAASPDVTVSPLDAPSPDTLGLLSPQVTGLPASLWSASSEATLVTLIEAERAETLPALRDLLITLMLAEADAPQAADGHGTLFLARVDKLLDLGALGTARALLDAAGSGEPEIYRRTFDVALLTGTEDAACEDLRSRPSLAPTYPARIFCMARNGDWDDAALTLNTARALGDVTDEEDALLSRFLDPAISDGAAPLPPPTRTSPLVFLMREAIGEGLTTASLPLAFAHADLRDTAAWRARMEAAERLARSDAIPETVLFDAYRLRAPAASGGVWDRAGAIQRLDAALDADDPGRVAVALPTAWDAMREVRTEVAFARAYGARLAALPLSGEAGDLAFRIGLLSPDYAAVGAGQVPQDEAAAATNRFLAAVARGDVAGQPPPADGRAAAVHAAFAGQAVPPPAIAAHIEAGRLGEALLRAISVFVQGTEGDPAAMTDALASFRAAGLDGIARRAALQYLILDRRT